MPHNVDTLQSLVPICYRFNNFEIARILKIGQKIILAALLELILRQKVRKQIRKTYYRIVCYLLFKITFSIENVNVQL